jgi:biopolymer transport protein ExbB
MRLEKGLPVLATLGANAPFIGLFGTVLGIVRAFAALSGATGPASNGASVMSGISQSLYATAAGLFVAIPAVVAFNILSQKLKTLIAESDALKDAIAARSPGAGA